MDMHQRLWNVAEATPLGQPDPHVLVFGNLQGFVEPSQSQEMPSPNQHRRRCDIIILKQGFPRFRALS